MAGVPSVGPYAAIGIGCASKLSAGVVRIREGPPSTVRSGSYEPAGIIRESDPATVRGVDARDRARLAVLVGDDDLVAIAIGHLLQRRMVAEAPDSAISEHKTP